MERGLSRRIYPLGDNYEIAAQALRHLGKKIRELKNDGDIKERQNFAIEVDLDENAELIEQLATMVAKTDPNRGSTIRLDESQKKIICHALDLYVVDLNESKRKILDKLKVKDEENFFVMKNLEILLDGIKHAKNEQIFKCSDER